MRPRKRGDKMRLDKYLKVSRIIKRRTVAKEVCDAGRIRINGRQAKAGSEVAVGDKLEITLGSKVLEAEILVIAENVRAEEASAMYKILAANCSAVVVFPHHLGPSITTAPLPSNFRFRISSAILFL